MAHYNIRELVRSIVIEVVGVDPVDFPEDTALVATLGLDSLQLLDLFFRIECCVPVILSVERCQQYLQGDVPDEEFSDERGIIRERGLARLSTVLPQLDPEEWRGRLRMDHLIATFTIGNVIAMIEDLMEQGLRSRAEPLSHV